MARSNRHRKRPEPKRATARIIDIADGGDGVALIDGEKVFVPLTAPGDLAEIEFAGERGRLVSLVVEGPDRAEAPCPHYGTCGGCALQHVTVNLYYEWKRRRVIGALERAGLSPATVKDTIVTQPASRRRATFAVRKHGEDITIGFNERRSSRISPIDGCLILHPDIAARLPSLGALAKKIDAKVFDLSVTLCDNGLDLDIAGKVEPPSMEMTNALIPAMRKAGAVRLSISGEALIALAEPIVSFDGVSVSPPPGAFLQASREGEEALIALVKRETEGAKKIADLFSGCGTFALPLGEPATISAFDSDGPAIAALEKAARAAQGAGLKPVRAEKRDLFERPLMAKELKQFDAIVFDPPRAGARFQAEQIAASGAALVIGVSCNPATFARDAALIVKGGYALAEVTPVDQFVYSPHVELVGVFRKAR